MDRSVVLCWLVFDKLYQRNLLALVYTPQQQNFIALVFATLQQANFFARVPTTFQ